MIRDRKRLVKLVRDRVGTFLPPRGASTYEPLDDHDLHVKLLRGKLVDEAVEYLLDPGVDELADVVQAVEDLAAVDLEVEMGVVLIEAQKKKDERGGFERGVGMFVETDERVSPHERDRR